uniref:hypothetical protein n=1 Tax=Escherichia coli TaxID=562 RepID=UPI003A5986ED
SNFGQGDLSRCLMLWKLPPSVCGLKKLRVWKMGWTAVVHLPHDFGKLQSLTHIDFEGCESLEELPDSFSELSNLETVDLSRCSMLCLLTPSAAGL